MHQPPAFAAAATREQIVAALKTRTRRFIDGNDRLSRNYLEKWEITADGLFADLAADLKCHHLYIKPPTTGHSPLIQRFQYVLPYPEKDDLPAVLVHITLSAKGHPPRVKVSVHPHNTGYAPLRRVPIT